MAGRGRGRGRGRGSLSFEPSQLGFTPGESLPAPVLQPPPTFPPLEYKPVLLQPGPEDEYMIALRKEFVEFLRCTLNVKQESEASPVIERFLDKYKYIGSEKEFWSKQFHWDRMPSELRPKHKGQSGKRKQENEPSSKSKKSNIDITSKLDKLAELEEKGDEESEEIKEEKADDEENEEGNLEEDEDDEMDDGTDYVNSYFDNGEGYYDDEDDNMDDGPVY